MQDFKNLTEGEKAEVIDSMILEEQYQITDGRDGKTYYISKLADGNIWMTQNLDLDLDANTTYTPADTDIPSDWKPSNSTYPEDSNAWVQNRYTPESSDAGDLCWSGIFDPELEIPMSELAVDCAGRDMHYHLGNTYNWTAAIAMNDSNAYVSSSADANQSICPAGWTLPKGGWSTDERSFAHLYDYYYEIFAGEMGSIHLAPLYFGYTGVKTTTLHSVGVSGYLWASNIYNINASYSFDIGVSDETPHPADSIFRYHGAAVRCVAR